MIKQLIKKEYKLYYIKDGLKIEGVHPRLYGEVSELYGEVSSRLYGDVSRLSGNVSGLYGDVSPRLYGDVSGLSGEVSGLSGEVSRLSGNLDACEITNEDREKGVDIKELIIWSKN